MGSRSARRRRPALVLTARLLGAVVAALVAVAAFPAPAVSGPALPPPGSGSTAAATKPARGWVWPLHPDPAVARRFQAPPLPWSPGHRGVDLAASAGQPVRAPAPARVLFAGTVVNRGVLTLVHAGGLRTTYEPVVPSVKAGDVVVAGQQVGTVAVTPGHCSPGTCLHWGARRWSDLRGGTYVDPVTLVRTPHPPVLLPSRGSSAFAMRAL